jgi:protein gp37
MSGPYWTDQWNPVTGCTSVSEGCEHCWARGMHQRFHAEPFSDVRERPERLDKPLHWRKPRTVFVCNTADLFHPAVSFEFIAAVYGVMAACPQHTFLVCTKRPDRRLEFAEWVARDRGGHPDRLVQQEAWLRLISAFPLHRIKGTFKEYPWPLQNVWEGTTVENQARANERIPILRKTPAAHRWVSAEPLLGWLGDVYLDGIDQIIVGGESGPGARPCNVEWIRSIRDQCAAAGTRCFVRRLGSVVKGGGPGILGTVRRLRDRAGADPTEWPEDLRVRELGWAR